MGEVSADPEPESDDLASGNRSDHVVLVLGDSIETALTLHDGKVATGSNRVGLASTSKDRLTSSSSGLIRNEQGADTCSLLGNRLVDTIKDVTLNDGVGTLVGVESMALHVLEVVVGSVEVTVGARLTELGGPASNVVEVVAVKSDLVALAVEHHGPVVVAVAGSRSVSDTVELGVGDGEAGAVVVGDDEHATNLGELAVVDPDTIVLSLELQSITSPDDTGVELGDLNALDDDVAGALLNGKTLSFQDSLAVTDDTLVASNRKRLRASGIGQSLSDQ
ncbi:hypothetical protein HG531_012364 [Fusarium graminearum]|nr:hypothetical protein HG531_012364 [Fusarium graminearum]